MEYRGSRATPEDFAIGATVAVAVHGTLFAIIIFSERIIHAIF